MPTAKSRAYAEAFADRADENALAATESSTDSDPHADSYILADQAAVLKPDTESHASTVCISKSRADQHTHCKTFCRAQ